MSKTVADDVADRACVQSALACGVALGGMTVALAEGTEVADSRGLGVTAVADGSVALGAAL